MVPSAVPAHYTSLAPFRGLFEAGKPCLTYHKLGPRPRGVRLRGLYMGARLFERQLSELRKAGFKSIGPGELAGHEGTPGRQIALTFDDGYANVLRHGLEPLVRHGFHAIQYLVADRLGGFNEWDAPGGEAQEALMDTAQVKEWLAAGHEIGSHTLTHPHLTRISPARAREEIFASRKKLEDIFGAAVRHFCHPYGDWNAAVRDLVIAAGYKTACTTEFGVNDATTSPFELKRITARHRSLSLKAIKARFAGAGG
jgi:peptidoglycan/xylan/chitin deacetylase (PgdA/CDA1 family)